MTMKFKFKRHDKVIRLFKQRIIYIYKEGHPPFHYDISDGNKH
jgi:hypothetical protein